jgi:hypothetical protein
MEMHTMLFPSKDLAIALTIEESRLSRIGKPPEAWIFSNPREPSD